MRGGILFWGIEKSAKMDYNMFNKVADTIDDTYPFPAL